MIGVCIGNFLLTLFAGIIFVGLGVDYGEKHGALWMGIGGYLFGGFWFVMAGFWFWELWKSERES